MSFIAIQLHNQTIILFYFIYYYLIFGVASEKIPSVHPGFQEQKVFSVLL